jgi:hypothetical protein
VRVDNVLVFLVGNAIAEGEPAVKEKKKEKTSHILSPFQREPLLKYHRQNAVAV